MLAAALETGMYFCVLYCGYRYGAGGGSIAGGVFGVIETMRLKNLGSLGILSIMGVLSGFFSPIGKLSSILGALAGAMGVGTIYAPDLLAKMIPSLVASILFFFLLPSKYCKKEMQRTTPFLKKKYLEDGSLSVQRLKEISCSLEQLSRSFQHYQEDENQISREDAVAAFQTASVLVCGDCRNCHLSRAADKGDNYYTYYLLQAFEQNGCLKIEDMPKLFSQACQKQEMYMDQINYSLGKAKNNLVWKNRFIESREMVAAQFLELSNIMGYFSERMGAVTFIAGDAERRIKRVLRSRNVVWEKLLILEQENKRKEIYIMGASVKAGCVTAKELADTFGDILDCRLKPSKDSKNVIHKENGLIHLAEDTNFMVLHGMARAVKEHGEVSGDNFSYFHLPEGRLLLGLSDGMGSGEMASRESEKVIELAEQLLESGFSMESAAKMVHSVLLLEDGEQQPTTLDLAFLDLYSGVMEGMKFGAASSFIIHKGERPFVEIIETESLPMGMLKEIQPEKIVRTLGEGDIIVMVTDGVIEAFPGLDKEEVVKEFLEGSLTDNPGDLADEILDYACSQEGEPRDDMLVLTVGLWRKQ